MMYVTTQTIGGIRDEAKVARNELEALLCKLHTSHVVNGEGHAHGALASIRRVLKRLREMAPEVQS